MSCRLTCRRKAEAANSSMLFFNSIKALRAFSAKKALRAVMAEDTRLDFEDANWADGSQFIVCNAASQFEPEPFDDDPTRPAR